MNIIKDLGEKPIKDILVEEGKAAVDELAQKGIKKLQKLQDGKGTAHSFTFKNIKRKLSSTGNQSILKTKKQRITTHRKKIKIKKQKPDIFSN